VVTTSDGVLPKTCRWNVAVVPKDQVDPPAAEPAKRRFYSLVGDRPSAKLTRLAKIAKPLRQGTDTAAASLIRNMHLVNKIDLVNGMV